MDALDRDFCRAERMRRQKARQINGLGEIVELNREFFALCEELKYKEARELARDWGN